MANLTFDYNFNNRASSSDSDTALIYPEDHFFNFTQPLGSSQLAPDQPIDSNSTNTQTETPSGLWNGTSEDSTNNDSISPPNTATFVSYATSLGNFGKMVKCSIPLSTSSEAKFDLYCETIDPDERHALQYALSLETLDLLKDIHKPGHWVVSEDLKKMIIMYCKAFLLSPTITSYRGNCSERVLKAMTELNVNGLPSEKNPLHISEVITCISQQLTSFRSVMKSKIQASVDHKKNRVLNIADLTHSLISSTPVVPTLQLWMRVAFLRYHFTRPGPKVHDHWLAIDNSLERSRLRAVDAKALSMFFNAVYDDDKKKYGDSAKSRHEPVQPKDLPGWLRTIDTHAMKVTAQAATAQDASSSAKAEKRKRSDDNGDE